jgi:hypothetical protein
MINIAEPEVLENGTIRWDEPTTRKGTQNKVYVWVECKCGSRRLVAVAEIRRYPRRKGIPYHGRCPECTHKIQGSLINYKKGRESSRYKGDRRKTALGYIDLAIFPGEEFYDTMARKGSYHGWVRYASEHRIVVARHLGRPLKHWEHVHHINGIKDDNRIENLLVVDAQTHSAITALESENERLKEELDTLKRFLSDNFSLLLPMLEPKPKKRPKRKPKNQSQTDFVTK